MFQKATFNAYGKLYELPHDNIYSDDQQKAIATAMLNDGLWKKWLNCGRKVTRDLGYMYPVDD